MVRARSGNRKWRSLVPLAAVLLTASGITACAQKKEVEPVVLSPQAQRGAALAKTKTCVLCHTPDGRPSMGPTWKGLLGRSRDLRNGTTVTADDAYIRRSITDPAAEILITANTVMPVIPLTDDEVSDLVAYIESL